jgi:Acetyltransferase (GNAT) domain
MKEVEVAVHLIDPLTDPRWPGLLERHPNASIFHTPEWLQALQRTYAYEAVVYTTSGPGQELTNGIPFCRIQSWLTGQRLVALPFADHCQPLVDQPEELSNLCSALEEDGRKALWKYIELRPLEADKKVLEQQTGFRASEEFCFHTLDLRPDLSELLRGLHPSCVRRPIRRAERERLTYEQGRSEALLAKFYHLLVMTRRRHQLPPQPVLWFSNLISCLGERLTIRVASKNGRPVAGIITLSYKDCMVYKYGGSDPQCYHMGGMIALLWQAVQEAKHQGATDFDMGRSACNQTGLVSFKDHWGALRSTITYYRYPTTRSTNAVDDWKGCMVKRLFAHAPAQVLTAAGRLLYRHMG